MIAALMVMLQASSFTVVGACHAAVKCEGKLLKPAVTETYCKALGGRSIRFSSSCKNL